VIGVSGAGAGAPGSSRASLRGCARCFPPGSRPGGSAHGNHGRRGDGWSREWHRPRALLGRHPCGDQRAAGGLASTTSTPSDRPLMMRLRRGSWPRRGAVQRELESRAPPCSAMRRARSRRLG
jgi:hypothetical protein